MFNVQLDENMFYTGSYAKKGTLKNGIDVTSLPPAENSLCYKLVDVEVTKSYEKPITQYIMYTESETEFEVSYYTTSIDEEGNEIYNYIDEDEYNALSDEEKKDYTEERMPKMVSVELTKEEYDALADEEKSKVVVSYKEDEEGNLVYETIYYTEIVKEWEFSQERYDELEAEKIKKEQEMEQEKEYQESISNEALKAENQMLMEQVEMLTNCILEMSEMLYA